MNSRTYLLSAFIIKRRSFGEADKIITVFSKELGKKNLIAKGIRRIKSRRAGNLELFNDTVLLVRKSRHGLDYITETQLNRSFMRVAGNMAKTQLAYQLIELIDKLTPVEQTQEEVYDLIQKAFEYLIELDLTRDKMDIIMLRFKLKLLSLLGFGMPAVKNLETVRDYIEQIIEKKLVAKNYFGDDTI